MLNYRFHTGVNIRGAAEGQPKKITGLAVPYGKWTRINKPDGGFFLERIQRGAAQDYLKNGYKTSMTVKHDYRHLLGDTASNLTLSDKQDGLYFELVVDNSKALQMIDGVRTGFFDKCSFSFKKTDWIDEDLGGNGVIWRTVKSLELPEIALVDDPAYRQTTAGLNGELQSEARGIRTAMRSDSADTSHGYLRR